MKIPKPTDPSAIVVPFGKHKGATVAELLAKDPQYADWVMAQGWVAERFAELHAAIATRGAGTDDTPEHNALQARFLDAGFRHALLRCADSNGVDVVLERQRSRAVMWCRGDLEQHAKPQYGYAQITDERAAKAKYDLERMAAGEFGLISAVQFEVGGVDIIIQWGGSLPDDQTFQEYSPKIAVELKPTVGDDYPSVMRQMKRLGCRVCVVGTYTGRGVSEVQLRQMFEANGQTLIFVQEIEEEARKSA